MFRDWGMVLQSSFHDIGLGVLYYIPNIIVAVIIFILGWVIAVFVGKLFEEIFKGAKVDVALRKAGVERVLNKGGIMLNSGRFVGELIKWFIIVVFLVAAFSILHLDPVTNFLFLVVVQYLPNVIAAVLILFVAAVVAETAQKFISASSRAAGVHHANLLGSIAKWAIWIFAILTALIQLGIATALVETLFTGVVVAVSLALGLSFGLGGQEAAARYIAKVQNEITDKR